MNSNPNEYDDSAWLRASNDLRSEMTSLLRGLWDAGASGEEIYAEVKEATEEAMIEIGAITYTPAPGNRPKKKQKS